MKPVYKQVKTIAEFCPECNERLLGNNSIANPWHCKCGEWEAEQKYPFTGEYIIKIKLSSEG